MWCKIVFPSGNGAWGNFEYRTEIECWVADGMVIHESCGLLEPSAAIYWSQMGQVEYEFVTPKEWDALIDKVMHFEQRPTITDLESQLGFYNVV